MNSIPHPLLGRRGRPPARRALCGSLARGALALSFLITSAAARAQDPPPGNPDSLAGTWRFSGSEDPTRVFIETFTSDGGSVEINNLQTGPAVGIGAWTRVGPGEFLATMHKQVWRIVRIQTGELEFQFNGSVKIRRHITLSTDGNQVTGVHKVEVFNLDGSVFAPPPGTFQGTRLFAEPLSDQARMLTPLVSGGDVTVRFVGKPGAAHGVERATSLNGAWQRFADVVVPTNGVGEFTDPAPPAPSGFYRTGPPSTSDPDHE